MSTVLTPQPRIGIRPLSDALGAEILGVDLAQSLDAEIFADVLAAWPRHGLILLRNQTSVAAGRSNSESLGGGPKPERCAQS